MDKQKQIKEMEKDIEIRMEMAKAFIGSMNNGVEGWLAEYLVKKGWIKPDEGALVLTREEHIQMLRDLNESNEKAKGIARKETAEKFAERVKMAFYYEFDELIPSIMASKIDEICKEITEDKNDGK